ncbi:hypothetical protein SBA3_1820057 [Candidatus Sulfopaludibacter sp. SbA3]|nr:hypothetical protein SBA3_1820057 [Candidatus Sulfopaludibacter sp. SbA3]
MNPALFKGGNYSLFAERLASEPWYEFLPVDQMWIGLETGWILVSIEISRHDQAGFAYQSCE